MSGSRANSHQKLLEQTEIIKSTIELFFVPCLVSISYAFVAQPQPRIDGLSQRTWRVKGGLPDDEVQAIAQTSDSFLWLGTPHALTRFDGFHFRDEATTQMPALHQSGISCLLAARDGSLWVGALNAGIVHITKNGAKLYGIESGLTTPSLRVLREDDDGSIWVGTDHGLFHQQGESFVTVGLLSPSIAAIVPDGKGGPWFGGHRLFITV